MCSTETATVYSAVLMQPDESNRSSSPLVIKSANNDSDWRLEEGDKPSRALQVVKELHSRYSTCSLVVDVTVDSSVVLLNVQFVLRAVVCFEHITILLQVPQAD